MLRTSYCFTAPNALSSCQSLNFRSTSAYLLDSCSFFTNNMSRWQRANHVKWWPCTWDTHTHTNMFVSHKLRATIPMNISFYRASLDGIECSMLGFNENAARGEAGATAAEKQKPGISTISIRNKSIATYSIIYGTRIGWLLFVNRSNGKWAKRERWKRVRGTNTLWLYNKVCEWRPWWCKHASFCLCASTVSLYSFATSEITWFSITKALYSPIACVRRFDANEIHQLWYTSRCSFLSQAPSLLLFGSK